MTKAYKQVLRYEAKQQRTEIIGSIFAVIGLAVLATLTFVII